MEAMFQPYRLGNLELANRFVFPPIKTGYGMPGGVVSDRQLIYYRQIARNGPAVIILEPVSVTPPKAANIRNNSASTCRKALRN